MSPLQVGTLISGVVFTATRFVCTVMELSAHRELVPANINALIAIGTTISWLGFFSALNCGKILNRFDELETGLRKDIRSYGELCTEDGRVDAAREYARSHPSPVLAGQRGYLSSVD